ncbi:MAG TPA: hypothetical protein VFE02_19580, partial [Candidatus Acidoferrales bacterium]|nr:hypothetical protein [Candidatus Acidoferrales bacterium]
YSPTVPTKVPTTIVRVIVHAADLPEALCLLVFLVDVTGIAPAPPCLQSSSLVSTHSFSITSTSGAAPQGKRGDAFLLNRALRQVFAIGRAVFNKPVRGLGFCDCRACPTPAGSDNPVHARAFIKLLHLENYGFRNYRPLVKVWHDYECPWEAFRGAKGNTKVKPLCVRPPITNFNL